MENYLEIAFKNASLATNQIKSNPKVGALIIKNRKVIAEGIHEVYGGPHAEINALNQVNESLEGAEMVVTLEPCSHHGKTPPCVDAIIASGIKKVTIGTLDPNPIVSGNGVKKLEEAGIKVIIKNDLKSQLAINQDYYKKIQTQLPYISLKTAMSLDGKIALSNRQSKWITSNDSRERVQQLRKEAGAILVGVGTILKDDPRLTVHDEMLNSPVRIILDTHLKTPLDAYVVKTAKEVPTWIFTASQASQDYTDLGVKIFHVPLKNERVDLETVFKEISHHPIKRILVESGPTLTTSLIQEGFIDEWHVFIAPKVLGEDALSVVSPLNLKDLKEAFTFDLSFHEKVGPDIYLKYLRKKES